jgi:hypothetical protein
MIVVRAGDSAEALLHVDSAFAEYPFLEYIIVPEVPQSKTGYIKST